MEKDKKTFTLNDLEVDSFVTTLTEKEQNDLIGGHPGYPPTECGNPIDCPAPRLEEAV
jgi:hypothetical protein